jgi:HAD superfamily hydrolase (TIGR01509 family)
VKIEAIIFDLDGTITRPYLDFDQIRAEIGDVEGPILEAMQKMSPEKRGQAEEILHKHELLAAENSQLNPGVYEVFDWLRSRNNKIGLITRNSRDSVERVCVRHQISFDSVVTREDGPSKPDSFPVIHTCREMAVSPTQSVVVGDYLFDLISGRRAGAISVLLTTQQNFDDFRHEADYVIEELGKLPDIIVGIENEGSKI